MREDDRYRELLQIIAALTERVYKLEQQAGIRVPPAPPVPSPHEPAGVIAPPEADGKSRDRLESQIGAHWLNRVGILAVLIGASYFLKYAFENAWIGPAGRVLIGLSAGLAAMMWSEYVSRRGFLTFSYTLKALGIGLLYLSLWASSQLYGLVSTNLVFLAMSSVTAVTVVFAVWHNAQVIASFGMIGAFITPLSLSTGENNAFTLFTYMTILNAGAVALVRYRSWIRVLAGSYVGTLILYVTWHSRFYTEDQITIAALAVSIYFAMYAAAPFLTNSTSSALLFLVAANAGTYFFQVYDFFHHSGHSPAASIPALLLGSIYLLLADRLTGRHGGGMVTMHWAMGLVLFIVAVPIGLNSHWITIGWFAEAGALVWVSRQIPNAPLKYFGAAALALGVLRLILIDNYDVYRLILNERIMTFSVGIAVLVLLARAVAAEGEPQERRALPVLIVTINVLALFALNQEIMDAWRRQQEHTRPDGVATLAIIRDFAYSALWMLYGAGLMVVGFWKKTPFLRWQALVLIGVTVGKVFLYDTSFLDRGYRILSLIALGIILLTTSFLYQRNWFKLEEQ